MVWLSEKDTTRASEPPAAASPPVDQAKQPGGTNPAAPGQPGSGAKDQPGSTGGSAPEANAGTAVGTDSGKPVVSPPAADVKLSFVGDVMFASKVEDLLKKNGWDYPYHYVKDYLTKADITVANLETPISTRGTPQFKEYIYRSSPDALPAFKEAGFDIVNASNNHILDYGQDALLDTMDELDKIGIKRVGIGRNSQEAYGHEIIEHNGIKVAFLGFSRVVPETGWFAGNNKPGLAETYSTKLPLEAIAKAREEADLVVVFAHWGVERKDRPVKEQTELAHKYIDQGADLVIASHPHVLQGFEQYKGKWIAYSLGNFIFTTNTEPATWESMILNATCTKERSCDLQMIPILTKGAQPVRMTEEDGAKLFDKMSRISVNAKLDLDGKVTWSDKAPEPPASDSAPPAKPPAAQTQQKQQNAPNKPAGGGAAAGANGGTNAASGKTTPAQPAGKPASGGAAKHEPPNAASHQEPEASKKQP
ncbi:CapA family protein [Paenibacillus piri]|uniref:CapA family protein n=2 Tax=Paenibacillus piri TaxID=2547395 RepID=A0A4R5KK87_9BACL|nr:CapA family protein [Paenibacillus piri]